MSRPSRPQAAELAEQPTHQIFTITELVLLMAQALHGPDWDEQCHPNALKNRQHLKNFRLVNRLFAKAGAEALFKNLTIRHKNNRLAFLSNEYAADRLMHLGLEPQARFVRSVSLFGVNYFQLRSPLWSKALRQFQNLKHIHLQCPLADLSETLDHAAEAKLGIQDLEMTAGRPWAAIGSRHIQILQVPSYRDLLVGVKALRLNYFHDISPFGSPGDPRELIEHLISLTVNLRTLHLGGRFPARTQIETTISKLPVDKLDKLHNLSLSGVKISSNLLYRILQKSQATLVSFVATRLQIHRCEKKQMEQLKELLCDELRDRLQVMELSIWYTD